MKYCVHQNMNDPLALSLRVIDIETKVRHLLISMWDNFLSENKKTRIKCYKS